MDCFGGHAATMARIADLGAAAILAFEGDQHVGQLQFRCHDPQLRSPAGIWNPDYWGDFGGRGPALPQATLGVFCFHVGQLTEGEDRNPGYQGRGIGVALLDHLIDWARRNRFAALVAKFTPPRPEVMRFMGGLPASLYETRGFTQHASWIDEELYEALRERNLLADDRTPEGNAVVGMCIKRL